MTREPTSGEGQDACAPFEDATDAVRAGDAGLAIRLVREQLRRREDMPPPDLLLGMAVLIGNDDLAEAAPAAGAAPDDPQVLLNLGYHLHEAAAPEVAVPLSRALALAPGSSAVLGGLAVAYDAANRHGESARGRARRHDSPAATGHADARRRRSRGLGTEPRPVCRGRRTMMPEPTRLLLTIVVAGALGVLAQQLKLPGGLILGAMVGSAAVALIGGGPAVHVPEPLRAGAFIVIGAVIGAEVTRSTLRALGAVLLPAVLAGLLIIVAGVAIAWLLRLVGLAPPGDVLATSPGALSVMSAMAVERGTGAIEVAVFHLVRVVMVLLSLPLLLAMLRGTP